MKRLALALLLALPAQAEIYKHVDSEGRVTYSNIPSKGAKKLDLGDVPGAIPAPRNGVVRSGGGSSGNATPSSFPRVDVATQRSRDQTKLQILRDELGSEQKLLDSARQKLTAAPADARQRDNVTMHEKNIEALQKEIARVQ